MKQNLKEFLVGLHNEAERECADHRDRDARQFAERVSREVTKLFESAGWKGNYIVRPLTSIAALVDCGEFTLRAEDHLGPVRFRTPMVCPDCGKQGWTRGCRPYLAGIGQLLVEGQIGDHDCSAVEPAIVLPVSPWDQLCDALADAGFVRSQSPRPTCHPRNSPSVHLHMPGS